MSNMMAIVNTAVRSYRKLKRVAFKSSRHKEKKIFFFLFYLYEMMDIN